MKKTRKEVTMGKGTWASGSDKPSVNSKSDISSMTSTVVKHGINVIMVIPVLIMEHFQLL